MITWSDLYDDIKGATSNLLAWSFMALGVVIVIVAGAYIYHSTDPGGDSIFPNIRPV